RGLRDGEARAPAAAPGDSAAARGAGDLSKSRGLVRSGDERSAVPIFRFVRAYQADYPIATMCRVLGVSTSGYYAWLKRTPSATDQRDAELREQVEEIHRRSKGTYGRPRIYAELKERGERVAQKRIARLMKASGLRGVCRRRRVITTQRETQSRPAPDLVQRRFSAEGPDQLWVADITHIPTQSGFLYLAVVLDAWSRRVVGWAMSTRLHA